MSRRRCLAAMAVLLAPAAFGLAGCGMGSNENEREILKTHGSPDPNVPQTAEEYELKNTSKRKGP